MEFLAPFFPRQLQELYQPFRLPRQVSDHLFVVYVVDAVSWKNSTPVLHKVKILGVVNGQILQVIGKRITVLEEELVSRVASIHWVSNNVNNLRIWKGSMNEPNDIGIRASRTCMKGGRGRMVRVEFAIVVLASFPKTYHAIQ